MSSTHKGEQARQAVCTRETREMRGVSEAIGATLQTVVRGGSVKMMVPFSTASTETTHTAVTPTHTILPPVPLPCMLTLMVGEQTEEDTEKEVEEEETRIGIAAVPVSPLPCRPILSDSLRVSATETETETETVTEIETGIETETEIEIETELETERVVETQTM